ncbi:Glucosamine--fructose-6-phosphate aminotransferase [isomerizing], partial [Dysosmobacter welbionis]
AEKYFDANNDEVYTMDIAPYSYQQEILDKLEAERTVRGYTRNLVVAATGTGKTVISALDYKRFCKQHPGKPCRLLFVAHREEILRQSLYTFRAVLKDANFGGLFVGNCKPESIDQLFLSIQTFNSQDFAAKTVSDFYDYIVVDEFHHAAAPTYQKLLSYYQPQILLGLTATPERMDGKSVLPYFNNRGIPSIFLTGKSSDEERKTAKGRLVSGEVRFIFVVDIYNEGVDIPEVNTVLFLRPTESLTIFLQQLGRGLRLAEDKECLTVLDFIGQANKRYNFEDKFAALLSNTTRSVTREIKDGFISAPKGCYIQLEKKAAKYILDNIRASYGNTAGLVSRVASFTEDTGLELTLANFLDYYHL